MSSATSIDSSAGRSGGIASGPSTGRAPHADPDPALRPWQFFLLAGMLCATAVVIVATGQSAPVIVILSLTVVAASLVALGVYRALVPLVLPEHLLDSPMLFGGVSRAALEREKTLVLRTIKELEFDFAMGKISRVDYDEMGGRLRARAMGLIGQLDAGSGYKGAIEQEVKTRIEERDVDGVAGSVSGGTNQPPPRLRPSAGASAKAAVPPSDTTSCTSCGVANDPDARFCKNCGSRLST